MAFRKGKKIEVETPGKTPADESEEVTSEVASDETAEAAAPAAAEASAEELEVEAEVAPAAEDAEVVEPEVVEAEEAEAAEEEPVFSETDELKAQLAAAQETAATAQDRFLRLQAEWDNFRKRNAVERETERARAAERVVKELLPIIDDLERAIAFSDKAESVEAFVSGISAIQTKFLGVLSKENVSAIDPAGEAFDANKHQAVGTVPDDSVYEETVMQVYQKGYEMAGRVLRPAMVTVSTGGATRPAEEKPEA